MAVQDKSTLKTYFETGDIPSQNQFEDLIDSLQHVSDTTSVDLNKQEQIEMANQLASIDTGFAIYYTENIENQIALLDVTQQNAENQVIKVSDTGAYEIKQYFLGDAPYFIRLKEFKPDKLGPNEYYLIYWELNSSYGTQRLFGNTLPDIPEGFEFGTVGGKRFYFQLLKRNIGQKIKVVNTNIKFVNKTDMPIEYRAEANYWSDIYRKEDTVTDHYDAWDYLNFYYNVDMRNETQSIVLNIYNLDTKELVLTLGLKPGQNYQNVSTGAIDHPRNILIECIRK